METSLLNLVMQLSTAERAALAKHLLDSLENETPDASALESWSREIAARIESIKQGDYSARDWRESIKESQRILAEEFPE